MWFDNVLIFFVPIIFYHWLYAYVIGNAWSWIQAICFAEEESGDLMGAGGETLWSSLMLLTLSNTNILSKYQVVFPWSLLQCQRINKRHAIWLVSSWASLSLKQLINLMQTDVRKWSSFMNIRSPRFIHYLITWK